MVFELNRTNLPLGPCAACLDHLEAPEHITGPLPDKSFMLQLLCPHRNSGAVAFVTPGQEQLQWLITSPVDANSWPFFLQAYAAQRTGAGQRNGGLIRSIFKIARGKK